MPGDEPTMSEPPADLAKPAKSPFGRKRGEPSTEEVLGELNRALPYSDEAEKSTLSSLVQDPEERIHTVRVSLPPEAFHHECNRIFFEQLLAFVDANHPVDPVLFSNWLRDKGLLERVGGAPAVSEIFTFVPSPAHFEFYLDIVHKKWLTRCAIDAHSRAILDLQNFARDGEDRDVKDVILNGEAAVFRVVEASQKQGGIGPVHSAVVVNEVVDHVTQLQENKGRLMGMSTGWPDVDRAIGGQGLEPGDVFVIGARPKMGKTNVLCSMAKSIAVDQGIPTLILSLEMSRRRLWNRILFGGFDIETSKASNGFLEKKKGGPDDGGEDMLEADSTAGAGPTRGDQENLQRGVRQMQKAPLYVYDESMNTNDLRATVRLMVRRHGIRVVMLDYIQLVDPVTKIGMSEERHQIAEVMKVIHGLKRSLGLTFICLAQANRSAESNPRHEPGPKDFDGGSAIEKYLDYGAFIHRPAKYKRWQDLDDKAQEVFRKTVEPMRRANPGQWSPDVPIRDGMGKVVKDEYGKPKMEWNVENDWNEHALLLLCLNRNGDDARVWLRFRPALTRFDARNTALYSNNAAHRQPGYGDKFTASGDSSKKGGRGRNKEPTAEEFFSDD